MKTIFKDNFGNEAETMEELVPLTLEHITTSQLISLIADRNDLHDLISELFHDHFDFATDFFYDAVCEAEEDFINQNTWEEVLPEDEDEDD